MTDTAAPQARTGGCRGVGPGEAAEVLEVFEADPLVACPAAEKFAVSGVGPGPEGRFLTLGGPERSLVFVGNSVLPLRGDAAALLDLGRAVGALGFGPMSVHGRREHVAALWSSLGACWDPPREIRDSQFLMSLERPVEHGLPIPGVRAATLSEFEPVLSAAAAMYREELGSDPFAVGSGIPFRRRVARSLSRGRTWVGVDDDEVFFKADIAAVSTRSAQIQGVWVRPDRRGAGLGTGGIAAVCAALQARRLTPSLVVNGSNSAARSAYRRVGMSDVIDYATVLM